MEEVQPRPSRSGRAPGPAAVLLALLAGVVPQTAVSERGPHGQEVFADFVSGAGPTGVRDVALRIDGRDVTEACRVTPLRISYMPTEDLAPGTHSVTVIVTDSLGRSFEKTWDFVVEETPEIIVFHDHRLLVELDPLPRVVRRERLRVSGYSQPGVEVELKVDGATLARDLTDISGRFSVEVSLAAGPQELAVAALHPLTGIEGPEAVHRLRRELPPEEGAEAPQPGATRRVPRPAAEGVGDDVLAPPVARRLTVPQAEPGLDDEATGPDREPLTRPHGERAGRHPVAEVVITKPDDGAVLVPDHATVLGRAPAGWTVTVLVDGAAGGDDISNPAGHFTVPRVMLAPGPNELVARAVSQDGQRELWSAPVTVRHAPPRGLSLGGGLALSLPPRRSTLTRRDVVRVAGAAWGGAVIEVEVNGRLAVMELAGADGRFTADAPLEAGVNHLVVEAFSDDAARSERSAVYTVVRRGVVRRLRPRPPVERLPGEGAFERSRPRSPVGGREP